MQPTKSTARYGWPAQAMHWLIAAFIVCQYLLAQLADRAEDVQATVTQLALVANHKSLGLTILALAALRLLLRLVSPPPPPPAGSAHWQIIASRATHWGFYALIFALPLSGWMYSSASAYSVSWFNLVQLPDLVGPNDSLKDGLHQVHEILAQTLLALAVVHLAAVAKHTVWDRDGVLGRMLSPASLILFVGALAGAFWTLVDVPVPMQRAAPPPAPAAVTRSMPGALPNADQTSDDAPIPDSALPAWNLDYAQSSIRFQGTQAGATFQGTWRIWQADIRFAADSLAASSAMVQIATTSASTADAERDTTLASEAWLDSARFATCRFYTTEFEPLPNGGYQARGTLSMKGVEAPVTFGFTVTQTASQVILEGSARLDRLRFNLGTGEWQDTTWIGQYVDVLVTVVARR